MPILDSPRPDPDALLARMQASARKEQRGKLRIYFGASAGVGKTYAMLGAARQLLAVGASVLVGVIETHGRKETMAMLAGLEVLPLKQLAYREKLIGEFDIDAALASGAALILVDELAHSNAPGSRHPKRWQDVEELLEAGIDVFTTVNVQHLDSLNDVVGGITGVKVSETVPDTVFDGADEVVLVDIPADELLARLQSGRVYQGPQAEQASKNFFRKGNLIALRELALRRTADRVEGDVRAYRVEKSIDSIWKTGASLLACLGADSDGEHIVRSTARLAIQLGTAWHAVYVETPKLQRLPAAQREQILKRLKLAQELGATTAVLSGKDAALEVCAYARNHNLSKILLGRAAPAWPWEQKIGKRIAANAPDIDLIEIGVPHEKPQAPKTPAAKGDPGGKDRMGSYLLGGAMSLLTALLCWKLQAYLDLANITMIFLLVVMLVAVRFGRGPSVLSTCVSVATLDFFFVPPQYTFAISDLQYLVTFFVMLSVGLITGHLTADLRFQARVAAHREARWRALYEFSHELSGALQTEQIFDATRTFIARTFRANATLLLPDDKGRLQLPAAQASGAAKASQSVMTLGIAQWAFDHAEPAGLGTDTLPGSSTFYLPLVAPMRTRGVLAIEPEQQRWILIPEQRQQLDTFAALAAIALERVHYIEVAQNALVSMESERLRNSLLAALSHDLRTPLTLLVGVSEALADSRPPLSAQQLQQASILRDESLRMSALVVNLLDMARIQSGEVHLNLQWQALEEVIGSALRASANVLKDRTIRTGVARDLPLVSFDALLLERVLCNLLENAAKYTSPGALIEVSAQLRGEMAEVAVRDNGPGLPQGREEAVFEKFTRGERESATPGIGLGLAICRAIIEAHGGKIEAKPMPDGGACIAFALKLGTPPKLPHPDEPMDHDDE